MSILLLLFGSVLLGIIYVPVVRDLIELWDTNPNYSHGFLIPFVVAYVVWTMKDAFAKMDLSPSKWGGGVLVAGLILRFVGEGVEILGGGPAGLSVKGFSFIIVLSGLIWLFAGTPYLKKLALPLAYLVFMIPLPGKIFDMMTLPLQKYATGVTIHILQLAGIPSLREGNLIALPSMTLGVVEACSGIRSLLTLLALAGAIVLIFIAHRPWWIRALLMISAVPIAVVTNALRVTVTGLMAHFWGEEMAQGFYHDFSGWLIFLAAFLLLCAEVVLLNRIADLSVQEKHA